MNQKTNKIALVGLEDAGKTTIIKYITENSVEDIEMKPTLGVKLEKVIFKNEIYVFWDYGGQKYYRTLYSEDPEKFFEQVHTLIFVIDIQATNKIGDAITYFRKIKDWIDNFNDKYRIIILAHKYDPGYITNRAFSENVERIKNTIKSDNYKLFETTIYVPESIDAALCEVIDIKGFHKCI